jgi:anti-sigma factor (TIGR02949 family)
MNCEEAQELITALVDAELSARERAALEAHLRDCPGCSLVAQQETEIKQALRARAGRLQAPADLRRSILADPRIFPRNNDPARRNVFGWTDVYRQTALAAAVLVALALPLYLIGRPAREPIAAAAVAGYGALMKNQLSLIRADSPDQLVAQLVSEAGGHFHPMGYDLTALRLQPAAGRVLEIHGRKVLVVVYQGEGGTLFCYTFMGSEADAPVNAAKFFDSAKRMSFYAFSRGRINAVMHREGALICILASEMPMEDLLQLTRAQARPS